MLKAFVALLVLGVFTLDHTTIYAMVELPSDYFPNFLLVGFQVLWWFSAVWFTNAALELFLWRRLFGGGSGLPRQRKLLTDLVGILLYAAAVMLVLVRIFQFPLSSAFATSGVIAVVLGLALQNTLGDLFAGLALNIERPFKAGDWLTFDGTQGQVMVTNWRATHIRTRTADMMIVPNGVLARQRLTNHRMPEHKHLANIKLWFAFDAPLVQVEQVLRDATLSVTGVMPEPGPYIFPHELEGRYIVYVVYFFTDDFGRLVITRGEVMREVCLQLAAAGLTRYLPNAGVDVSFDGDRDRAAVAALVASRHHHPPAAERQKAEIDL